jgi:hypothetical protein
MKKKTRVYITVDVEAAEERIIRGHAVPPQGYDVRVWCRFRNQGVDLGIGLLMRELEAHGLRGTFFVETLGARFFGLERLKEACEAMHGRGHDVQLHTHPIQRNAAFRSKRDEPVPDDIAAYDVATQASLLREGLDILVACGVPREEAIAFRAGNFGANNDTWAAMKQTGLVLSSNYNPCYFGKNCQMRHGEARPGLFVAMPGVWELPITNFDEGGGAFKHVQITAISSEETRDVLWQARALGIEEVCIVTHSFELCHIDDVVQRTGRVNTVNLRRMRSLCRFLAENSADFEVETVGTLAARLHRGEQSVPSVAARAHPRGRPLHKARRLLEQAYKRLEARVPIALPTAGWEL